MTRDKLVFDWSGSEARLIDKIVAPLLVVLFFSFFFGLVDIRVGSGIEESSKSASIMRFDSEELSNKWLLVAEEGGPFPGRLEIDSSVPGSDASLNSMAGDPFANSNYEVSMRPISPDFGVAKVELAAKGMRTFPKILNKNQVQPVDVSSEVADAKQPVIRPYDKAAVAWMPEELPLFIPEKGTDTSGSPWRFALNLRSDGTIRDFISLGGGEAGLEEISVWLRGVTFGSGEDDRWMGLRVEIINRRDDGSGTE
ncbi:MAG: hypothetical protein NWR51_13320 [Akkermansiaceae bacterium]|jgi:hypothetical protein|nr:hypothetical protein [Akkermansiaceae bacterium]MDP4779158.1 hypothetical protein [Akkermansiaceae bacterium]MDP4848229.1 hypothetical protein [Akkermansiaceae bacterium]